MPPPVVQADHLVGLLTMDNVSEMIMINTALEKRIHPRPVEQRLRV